jgi:hypothetical protein
MSVKVEASAEFNARDFEKKVKALVVQVKKKGEARLQYATLQMLTTLTFETPRDQGRASGNWLVGLGAERLEVTDVTTRDESIQRGTRDIQTHRIGQPIFLSNSVPYIGALNRGHSAQAPRLFVEISVRAVFDQLGRTPFTL